MFLQACVILFRGGLVPGGGSGPGGGGSGPRGVPGGDPPRMATAAVGTHPTGMHSSGFPLGLENLEKWEGIFQSGKSQGILNRLEKSGKSQGKPHKILEN